jgi:hypothetical protein
MGAIDIGNTATDSVSVSNKSTQQVEVTARIVGGGFELLTSIYKIVVPAGGSTSIPIFFTPSAATTSDGLLKIAFGDEEIEVEVQAAANQPPRIAVATTTIDFDLVAAGRESTPRRIRVENIGGGLLEIYDLSSSRRQYRIAEADSLPVQVPAGGERYLHVYFKPTDTGTVRADLTLFTNDSQDEEVSAALGRRTVRRIWMYACVLGLYPDRWSMISGSLHPARS